ncbi:hypothetical protein EDB19DRAFT_1990365 [Suillus lakei]|nr:hypothetical protein EDB19DRAFT_1990365 [Suillus lakei]
MSFISLWQVFQQFKYCYSRLFPPLSSFIAFSLPRLLSSLIIASVWHHQQSIPGLPRDELQDQPHRGLRPQGPPPHPPQHQLRVPPHAEFQGFPPPNFAFQGPPPPALQFQGPPPPQPRLNGPPPPHVAFQGFSLSNLQFQGPPPPHPQFQGPPPPHAGSQGFPPPEATASASSHYPLVQAWVGTAAGSSARSMPGPPYCPADFDRNFERVEQDGVIKYKCLYPKCLKKHKPVILAKNSVRGHIQRHENEAAAI